MCFKKIKKRIDLFFVRLEVFADEQEQKKFEECYMSNHQPEINFEGFDYGETIIQNEFDEEKDNLFKCPLCKMNYSVKFNKLCRNCKWKNYSDVLWQFYKKEYK